MPDPLIVTQLREKQAEIERQIEGLNVRLADARANLLHVVGTTLPNYTTLTDVIFSSGQA